VGCPIRRSRDQRSLASPPGFSQRATSFIASQCQGIHQMPFSSRLSTTPNGRARDRRSEIRGQINQSPCSVRHSRDPPPMRQFSPLEDTSDTHRAHGSTRSRHKRASSRAPKPNKSRTRRTRVRLGHNSLLHPSINKPGPQPVQAPSQEFHLHAEVSEIGGQRSE
jgi:hypothetical protein